jgi:hypothetical protein
MAVIDEQFAKLQKEFPNSSLQSLPSGATLITVENVQLPVGWSAGETTVRFIAPVGYPHAKPDCFWTNPELRLSPGNLPQATGDGNQIPETNQTGLWFSWHASQWNPNRDTLLTYLNVIRNRFRLQQ